MADVLNMPGVREAPPPIPAGCICAYTWSAFKPGAVVRNSPVLSCPADHSRVDGRA